MTATQFTDDAYNKNLKGLEAGNGTLVGNWYEEVCQRSGSGEGRTVPQRHVRRSGLLRDFTRVPTDGTRKGDNTFERMYGFRKYEISTISSREVGKPDGQAHVTGLQSDPMQASTRIPQARDGVRETRDRMAFRQHAEEYVQAMEDGIDELRQRRSLTTTSGDAYTMPNQLLVTGPLNPKTNVRKELLSGPPLPEAMVYQKLGCDYDKQSHYTLQEPVTAHTEFASNPESRSAVNITPTVNGFRKDHTISTPTERFTKGAEKDSHEPSRMDPYIQMSQIDVMGVNKNGQVSLVDVKRAIADKFAQQHGMRAFIELRMALESVAQADATVTKADAQDVLDVPMPPAALKAYIAQMATMSKNHVQITKVMSSLRPQTPSQRMQLIAQLYDQLPKGAGTAVDLGQWALRMAPGPRRDMVASDLGVPEELEQAMAQGGQLVLAKDSLYEYLADFSAGVEDDTFLDTIEDLLPR